MKKFMIKVINVIIILAACKKMKIDSFPLSLASFIKGIIT
tara:strand:- start:19 stop:138 length:120 start_codon:yes stop_codon:yes gene_type:complete